MNRGASVKLFTYYDDALSFAVQKLGSRLTPEFAQLLANQGADLTPLTAFKFAQYGRLQMLNWMLDRGLNPNLETGKSRYRYTLLMTACRFASPSSSTTDTVKWKL